MKLLRYKKYKVFFLGESCVRHIGSYTVSTVEVIMNFTFFSFLLDI